MAGCPARMTSRPGKLISWARTVRATVKWSATQTLPKARWSRDRHQTGDSRRPRCTCTLGEQGLEIGELLDWETAPLIFSFLDPDGNRYYVTEVTDPGT